MRVGFYQSLIGVACIAATAYEASAVQMDSLAQAEQDYELAQLESRDLALFDDYNFA